MAEFRFSSRRGNNYAGSGRRIYANFNDLQAGIQEQDWLVKRAAWGAHPRMGNQKPAGMGNALQEEEEDDMRAGRLDDGKDVGVAISSNHANGKGYFSQDQEEDMKRAAGLMLGAGGFLFADLCESCSATLRQRLNSIAAGEGFSAFSTDSSTSLVLELPASSDRCSGDSNSISVTEGLLPVGDSQKSLVPFSENGVDNYHAEGKPAVESRSAKIMVEKASCHEAAGKKDGLVQAASLEQTVERNMDSAAARSNDSAANVIIKSALYAIRDAPAYRTRSISRQAGLLQTPAQKSEFDSDIRENARILEVGHKKDFCLLERVNGQIINILEGLELHTNVFNSVEQKELIDFVYELQDLGRSQKLRKRTYSEPRKWMRGKGRVTIQFGCCYNYAVDKDGNPPGIIREEDVDDIPYKLRMVIKRLVQWQVLPSNCIPDSCIVNIYDIGDCIPPHIDHHDFVRPFCTLSLLSECDIVFGTNLKIAGPGEFKGSFSVPLPTGSVLILNGNGADVAKHAVPAVPSQRISITFRKMDPQKVPHNFRPDTQLLSTQPLTNGTYSKSSAPVSLPNCADGSQVNSRTSELSHYSLHTDFPALGEPVFSSRHRNLRS